MSLFDKIFTFIMILISFNSLWYKILEQKTNSKINKQGDFTNVNLMLLVFLLGPIMLLFTKSIKRKRTYKYLECRINMYRTLGMGASDSESILGKDIIEMERMLKFSKIKLKTKKRYFKTNILKHIKSERTT